MPLSVTLAFYVLQLWPQYLGFPVLYKARNSGQKRKEKRKVIHVARQGWPEEAKILNRTRSQLSFPNVMLLLEIMTG